VTETIWDMFGVPGAILVIELLGPHFSWLRLKIAFDMPIHTRTPPFCMHLTLSTEILLEILSHLIYASSADSKMSDAELRAILYRARTVNSQLDITGILLHTEGSYFQVLEGDAEAIDSLYAKIAHDKRHTNVVLIVREPIASRSFADWSMGFASVTSKDVAGIIGANDFFQKKTCFYDLSAGRAKKLLAAFADGRWRAPSAA
jgi:hypothetical protein